MGVGHGQQVEHALDAAVLAEAAVQRVEHDVGPRRRARRRQRSRAGRASRRSTSRRSRPRAAPSAQALPLDQRDLALGRPAAHQDRDALAHAAPPAAAARRCGGFPSRSAMPLASQHAAAHFLAQRLDVGGGGVAGVDQEVAVLLGDLRAADGAGRGSRRRRSAPRPCGRAGWRRSSRRCARDRLRSPRARRRSRPCGAAIATLVAGRGRAAGAGEDPVGRRAAVAIGEAELAPATRCDACRARSTRLGRDQHVRELAAIGAGVHRAARRRSCRECRTGIRARRAPASRAVSATLRSSAAAPATTSLPSTAMPAKPRARRIDHARHAAVAHQQVRADAEHGAPARRPAAPRGRRRDRRASAGRNSTSAGPPTRNQVMRAERRVGRQPAARPAAAGRSGADGRRERHHAPAASARAAAALQRRELAGQRVRPVR